VNVRDAELMVQKNSFHYRLFHIFHSFRHLPVVSQGATSLQNTAKRQMTVPSYPTADPDDWREGDRMLRTALRDGSQPTA
jgi:hypothetical protein